MDGIRYLFFEKYLREEIKLPESRVASFSNAIAELHSALCHLDNENMEMVLDFEIENFIKEFSKREQLKNVFEI